jgi:hypothetical protein
LGELKLPLSSTAVEEVARRWGSMGDQTGDQTEGKRGDEWMAMRLLGRSVAVTRSLLDL